MRTDSSAVGRSRSSRRCGRRGSARTCRSDHNNSSHNSHFSLHRSLPAVGKVFPRLDWLVVSHLQKSHSLSIDCHNVLKSKPEGCYLTCRMTSCFGKRKSVLRFDWSKDHCKRTDFFAFRFAFAKATSHSAGQVSYANLQNDLLL